MLVLLLVIAAVGLSYPIACGLSWWDEKGMTVCPWLWRNTPGPDPDGLTPEEVEAVGLTDK